MEMLCVVMVLEYCMVVLFLFCSFVFLVFFFFQIFTKDAPVNWCFSYSIFILNQHVI